MENKEERGVLKITRLKGDGSDTNPDLDPDLPGVLRSGAEAAVVLRQVYFNADARWTTNKGDDVPVEKKNTVAR